MQSERRWLPYPRGQWPVLCLDHMCYQVDCIPVLGVYPRGYPRKLVSEHYLVTPMPFQIKRRISPLQSFPQTDFSGKTQVKSIWKQNLKNLPWLPLPVEQSPDTQLTYQTLHSRAPDGPLAWSPAALPPGPLCPVTSMSSNPSPAFGVCCPADMLQWSVCSGSLLLTFWKIIIIVFFYI